MLDQQEPMERQQTRYLRFTHSDRVEHWLQVITFVALAFTGLIQKWPDAGFSRWAIRMLGGIETTRLIHRVFATLLLIAIVYHLYTAGKRVFVDRAPRTMLPGRTDLQAAWQSLRFNLGRTGERPQQGRFTWEEKIEYWAIVWGTLVMTVTGFMLWNPIATARFLPGQFIPAAKAAHGGEALLAVLAILVWHFYHVHIRHFNTSIFTGYISQEEMEAEHSLELADIEAGKFDRPPVEVTEQRRRRFVPVYSVTAGLLLVGIYFFVTFEETAIQTIEPPEDVTVFVPAPTPTVPLVTSTTASEEDTTTTGPETTTTTTPIVEALAWETGVSQLFVDSCGACHAGDGGLGGLNISAYETTLSGGNSGPGIVPGDPEASAVYTLQLEGGHPGQFADDELAMLLEWIENGAPETAALSWDSIVGPLLVESCEACHGAEDPFGDLNLTTYETALAGGESGPGFVPEDPEDSIVYTLQLEGGHPGQLTDDDLELILEWIEAGAPETDSPTWAGLIGPLLTDACGACHGRSGLGGLNLSSYDGALEGGNSGPGIVPGDPDGSEVYVRQLAGGHPGQLTDQQIADLAAWIEAGAPEG